MKMVAAYDGTGPRTSADGFSCSASDRRREGGCEVESPSMSLDNIPPPAMFSSSSSSSEHQSNKFLNFGCAECEGQAEHERIKSLLKQKKGKGGKHPKLTENPENPENSEQGVVWTKSSYSTLPNPRSRGHSLVVRCDVCTFKDKNPDHGKIRRIEIGIMARFKGSKSGSWQGSKKT